MAKSSKDYFGLEHVISIILAIIPITEWVLGFITRFQEGKWVAGLVRVLMMFTVVGGIVVWVADIVFIIKEQRIWRLLNA